MIVHAMVCKHALVIPGMPKYAVYGIWRLKSMLKKIDYTGGGS
jgi:hypothetical protein